MSPSEPFLFTKTLLRRPRDFRPKLPTVHVLNRIHHESTRILRRVVILHSPCSRWHSVQPIIIVVVNMASHRVTHHAASPPKRARTRFGHLIRTQSGVSNSNVWPFLITGISASPTEHSYGHRSRVQLDSTLLVIKTGLTTSLPASFHQHFTLWSAASRSLGRTHQEVKERAGPAGESLHLTTTTSLHIRTAHKLRPDGMNCYIVHAGVQDRNHEPPCNIKQLPDSIFARPASTLAVSQHTCDHHIASPLHAIAWPSHRIASKHTITISISPSI